MKKILAFLLAAMLLLSIVGCAAQTQSDAQPAAAEPAADTSQPTQDSVSAADGDTVAIGYYLPLSGANATYSPYYLNAINPAIKKINAEGGLNGKQIVTASYDTTSSTEEAAKVATKLVTVDKISICISSPMSSEVLASSKTLNDAGVFTMVMGISSALLDPESFEYGFRGSFNTDNTIPACLNMIDTLGAKRVAILFSQGDASITNATQFRDQSTELGYDCTAFETFDLGEMDYSAQCINIVSTNPDCVFLAVEGDYMGTCVKQLRQYGFEGTIISREELSIPQREAAGDAMNGYAFPSLYVSWPSLEEAKPNVNEQMYSYLESYYNEYGELPASIWAYEVWDAMMTLQQAAKLAGSNDPAALRDAMNQLTYTGIGGTIDYTDGRHESYSADAFNVFIYEDGKVVSFTK